MFLGIVFAGVARADERSDGIVTPLLATQILSVAPSRARYGLATPRAPSSGDR